MTLFVQGTREYMPVYMHNVQTCIRYVCMYTVTSTLFYKIECGEGEMDARLDLRDIYKRRFSFFEPF